MVVYMYITMRYVDFISSPYLLVFGDDRVRGNVSRECWCRWCWWCLDVERGIAWDLLLCFIDFSFGNDM